MRLIECVHVGNLHDSIKEVLKIIEPGAGPSLVRNLPDLIRINDVIPDICHDPGQEYFIDAREALRICQDFQRDLRKSSRELQLCLNPTCSTAQGPIRIVMKPFVNKVVAPRLMRARDEASQSTKVILRHSPGSR